MTQDVSELMDGELRSPEADRAIRRCCGEEGARDDWRAYHLIREVMHGEPANGAAATQRILAAIEAEPTVLSPRRYAAPAARIALAAAASVATVAVVAWIGLQGESPVPSPLAAKAVSPTAVVAPVPPPSVAEAVPGIQDYVVVHRQVPAADFYRAVSVTEAIR